MVRGAKDPIGKKKQVHTGNPQFSNKEIRRASEQTSPQVARAIGLPGNGTMRRIEQWQQLGPPFSVQQGQ